MSSHPQSVPTPKRFTVPQIQARKGREPIVCLTSYHAHTARLIDPYVDLLLVGDSLGMVMYGMESTLGVTLDMMIAHGRAVVVGSDRALVVIDMPFGTYEESPKIAFRNAAQILKETNAQAIKLEGGQHIAPTIDYLKARGIPVMAHIGLTPQSINVLGGFKAQGCVPEQWERLIADAHAVAKAGAFAVVLEAMAAPLATKITAEISIPTIGIGAGANCDGQILVSEDMLGLSPKPLRFVKEFATLGAQIAGAADAYATAVRTRVFPASNHTYPMETHKGANTHERNTNAGRTEVIAHDETK